MSRAKMFYDISKRTEGLVSGNDFITLDEVQTISFTDVDEMRAALKGYLESGIFTVGNYEGTADTRDTEAVKRIATAYLKLLFPNVREPGDITAREFKRYCLDRARKMRDTIKYQLGVLDAEYRGKDMPAFSVRPDPDRQDG